jgi:hypothetical protein
MVTNNFRDTIFMVANEMPQHAPRRAQIFSIGDEKRGCFSPFSPSSQKYHTLSHIFCPKLNFHNPIEVGQRELTLIFLFRGMGQSKKLLAHKNFGCTHQLPN